MSLTPTLRTSERHMVTVRSTHHLGGRQLAVLLCNATAEQAPRWYDLENYPGTDLTRAEAEDLIRDTLWARGEDAFADEGFGEDDDPADSLVLVLWAARQVHRLFPDMADDDLQAWSEQWQKWSETGRTHD